MEDILLANPLEIEVATPILDEPMIGELHEGESNFFEFKTWAIFLYHLSIQIDRLFKDETDKLKELNVVLGKLSRKDINPEVWYVRKIKQVTTKESFYSFVNLI